MAVCVCASTHPDVCLHLYLILCIIKISISLYVILQSWVYLSMVTRFSGCKRIINLLLLIVAWCFGQHHSPAFLPISRENGKLFSLGTYRGCLMEASLHWQRCRWKLTAQDFSPARQKWQSALTSHMLDGTWNCHSNIFWLVLLRVWCGFCCLLSVSSTLRWFRMTVSRPSQHYWGTRTNCCNSLLILRDKKGRLSYSYHVLYLHRPVPCRAFPKSQAQPLLYSTSWWKLSFHISLRSLLLHLTLLSSSTQVPSWELLENPLSAELELKHHCKTRTQHSANSITLSCSSL